jgi:SAM-dependent methyltransferase
MMNLDQYFHVMTWEYFFKCSDKTVLEIGPLHGEHSKLILQQNPKSLDLIDIDAGVCKNLESLGVNKNLRYIINQDIHKFLEHEHLVDVVVCLGLIYHLHSPIKLLELIVNATRAQIIILDGPITEQCMFQDDPLGYTYTNFNKLERKTNLSLLLPFAEIKKFMDLLGYRLIKYETMSVPDFWKNNIWMAIWERE